MQGQEGGQERPDLKVVKNDMKGLGLARADALGRHIWKRRIVGIRVCLMLPWDSSQDEQAVKWCMYSSSCVQYIVFI